MTIMNDEDDYDYCYECSRYGDDCYYDPEQDCLVSSCPECPMNPDRPDDEE